MFRPDASARVIHSSIESIALGQDSDVASDSEWMIGIGLYASGSPLMSEVNLACSSSGAGESAMGRNTCGVPMQVNTGFRESHFNGRHTVAVERASVSISIILLSYTLALRDHVARAL